MFWSLLSSQAVFASQMFKSIKGPQRQLKTEDICVRDRKVLGTLRQMSGAEDFSKGVYASATGHKAMGTQAPYLQWSMNILSIMPVILLTVLSVCL